jgi:D-alanine--poly(phosphoribitol) ligase subunit 1
VDLTERIDHWVTVAPDAVAHRSGGRVLTYGQLGTQANALAARLNEYDSAPGAPVAVLGHREPEMLVAFLASVKAGRPYVPIDTALPQERINHIVRQARPALVLNAENGARMVQPNDSWAPVIFPPDKAFYIIFTSGSTGEPKGIVITRSCLQHFIEWMLEEQQFTPQGEVFLNQAPFSFDLSVMDLYCSMTTGGTLFSISRDHVANPKELYRALAASNITTWVSTPSFAEMCLVERNFDSRLMPEVRRFLFCGEILLPSTVRLLLERFPEAAIWNFYGPTETTVATSSVQIDRDLLKTYPTVPVGRVMPGTEVYLLAEDGEEIARPGGRGEIVIKGPNVSPGYFGRPDLTAACFETRGGQRAYRTGDWGRFVDGLLFFEGRVDDQVKVNGYRIELGDIETHLRAMPGVQAAAVVPACRNGKVQWLAGFVVANGRLPQGAASLMSDLRQRLPAYMLPRKLIILAQLPMSENGKVDRRRLADSL